jgi:5-methylcytosine-specific restriction endonuclease McrA
VSGSIPAELRALVSERADGRCEYCGLAQAGQEATFHIEHVVPRSAGGPTDEANLALACVGCSLRKGARAEPIADTSRPRGADARA